MRVSLHDCWRPLGSTDLQISPLGLGTVKLGRDQGVKYPDGFQIPDERSAANLLALARDLGINLLDTAPAYGVSEQRLGPLLRGQRHDWVLCSKVGEEFEQGRSHFDFSAAHTRYSVERSLRRLHTDYLDLVLVHSDGNDLAILQHEGVYAELARLRQAGLIRAFGFSGKTVEGGIAALADGDCAMVTYNLAEQGERAVLDHATAQHKGILIKKALASGHLCRLPAEGDQPAAASKDPVRASFELIFAHQAVGSVIVGTINPQHLQDNVTCAVEVLAQQRR